MLNYLVTSRTRRRLLDLLWRHEVSGSVDELARRAGVSYGAAYRELKAMVRHGLATTRLADGVEVYLAAEHPDGELIRGLLTSRSRAPAPRDERAAQTRRRLRSLGAPLPDEAEAVDPMALEQTLVDGVDLARRDPTVARVLPIVLWRVRDALDLDRLEACARKARNKHAVGFFLALTGALANDRKLGREGERLRDARATGTRPFFETPSTRAADKTAERRTPEVARHWGYVMNLDLESFRSHFEKFVVR